MSSSSSNSSTRGSSSESGEGRTIDLFSRESGGSTMYDYYIDMDEKVIKYDSRHRSYGSDCGTTHEFEYSLDQRIIKSLIDLIEPHYGKIKRKQKRY